jgi:hypothetical protein
MQLAGTVRVARPDCSQQDAQHNAQCNRSSPFTEISTAGHVSFSQTKASPSLSQCNASTAPLIFAVLVLTNNPKASSKNMTYVQFILVIPLNSIRVWESNLVPVNEHGYFVSSWWRTPLRHPPKVTIGYYWPIDSIFNKLPVFMRQWEKERSVLYPVEVPPP